MSGIVGSFSAERVPADGSFPRRPLTVARTPGGEITVTWRLSCLPSDTDYAVYEEALGAFDSHLPVSCSTGGATTLSFLPAAGSTYYLVAPHDGAREGSLETDGGGDERPTGAPLA